MSLRNKKTVSVYFALTLLSCALFAQEALKSTAEEYYDFLSLQGLVDRPTLNYRTLSDSVWAVKDESGNIWSGNNLGTTKSLTDKIKFRMYGPELFNSYNSAAPYGQNDGVLWQGKGLNSSLTGGVRFEGYGFEVTLKPEVVFSQNQSYETVPSAYSGSLYAGKADTYGDFGVRSVDAPQRFGDDQFWNYSWGDSEIRYVWKTLTVGFGTQNIWLGPAHINPLLHSNNAAPYPKLDIGIRKQEVTIPWVEWYAGDIEFRAWWGRTTESNYFDNDSTNDHNLITAITASFAPSILPGLTFGINRTMLSKWNSMDASAVLTLLYPLMNNNAGSDDRDQRASVSVQYRMPKAGAEVYVEWGRNDFSPNTDYLLRYPFHTQAYTTGIVKTIRFPNCDFAGEIIFEITNLESSRDYEFLWDTTFYAHHLITQGYTNGGQWIGAGIGTGGNSQYLGFNLIYPHGNTKFFVQRVNPNNDYVWFYSVAGDTEAKRIDESRFKVDISTGFSGTFFPRKTIALLYGVAFVDSQNYNYESNSKSIHRFNISIQTGISFAF